MTITECTTPLRVYMCMCSTYSNKATSVPAAQAGASASARAAAAGLLVARAGVVRRSPCRRDGVVEDHIVALICCLLTQIVAYICCF